MVAMYRKDRNGNVDIKIFVVDMIECPISQLSCLCPIRERLICIPLKGLTPITKHFQLAGFFTVAVHPQGPHNLEHRFP